MEGLKPFKEMFSFDERQEAFVGTPREIHAQIEAIELDEKVPDEIRETFDLARNLGLYSMAVYGFNRITPLIGFIALEQALKEVAKRRAPELFSKNRNPMLRELLDHALREGWISEDKISDRRNIAFQRVSIKKTIEAGEQIGKDGNDEVIVDVPTDYEIECEMERMRVVEQICESAKELRNA
ncbi:MAG: hypothetical protein R3270_02820, partial [Gammaproteobacteria bacterium]|nr:hypothetical protein [Gammaproteobacteria bacterium]